MKLALTIEQPARDTASQYQPSLLDVGDNGPTIGRIIEISAALGAATIPEISQSECNLLSSKRTASIEDVVFVEKQILRGEDPLGEELCRLRSPETRRATGATFTPKEVVAKMVAWAEKQAPPQRIVDPGVGSARFLLACAKAFPKAALIGVDIDPVSSMVARANLAVHELSARAKVILRDYRDFTLPNGPRTLFIGNPPYVRHHSISPEWKRWLDKEASLHRLHASKLAGLHSYFFLKTASIARPGDFGIFITAAEWLDVNYGSLVRSLALNGLGVHSISVVNAAARLFPDALTTAAITTFEIGVRHSSVCFSFPSSASDLDSIGRGRFVSRDRLSTSSHWSTVLRKSEKVNGDHVELGEICSVHRGQVTGSNAIWISDNHNFDLPASVLFPCVTRARELIDAPGELISGSNLKKVVDLPQNLDGFLSPERGKIERFLKFARDAGAHLTYVARHRRAWWSVGLRSPAPILATYMARSSPSFILNTARARHINIAHGIYPKINLSDRALRNLVAFLQAKTSTSSGRTYAGGLVKFEPGEMERLLVPKPSALESLDFSA